MSKNKPNKLPLTEKFKTDINEIRDLHSQLPEMEIPETPKNLTQEEESVFGNEEIMDLKTERRLIAEKFLPEGIYTLTPIPKKILVTCDDTAAPYKITATLDGETIYTGEGVDGIFGLIEYQAEHTDPCYYIYDNATVNKCSGDWLSSLRISRPSKTDPQTTETRKLQNIYTPLLSIGQVTENMITWSYKYLQWIEDPSFYNSFYFIKNHPSMWLNDEKTGLTNPERPIWLWHELNKRKDGTVVHMFETGTAVEPHRLTHYHSIELDIYSSTYEKGIIKLAKTLNKHASWNGKIRNPINYDA